MGHCDCEVDLPVLKKFFFCLPLRPGLIAYGFLQLMAVTGIASFSITYFSMKINWNQNLNIPVMTLIFVATILYSILEIINSAFFLRGAFMKHNDFLEVSFHYQRYKVMAYAFLLIICFFVTILSYNSYNFFYYNFDLLRSLLLNRNIAIGVLDWILQFYVLLLVRSQLLTENHVVDLPTLYGRLRPPSTINRAEEPKKEPLPDGFIQYP